MPFHDLPLPPQKNSGWLRAWLQVPHNSQSAFCFILIHVQQFSCARTNKTHIAYLSSWHKSIFDNKLKTKILKLRTTSLNSEFTGSYKKVLIRLSLVHKNLQNFLEVYHKKKFTRCGGSELMVRNRNSGARCGIGIQMVRRCAVRNRLAGAGAHHWLQTYYFFVII